MEYETVVQASLDEIDRRITESICVEELARTAGYSPFHFSRIFTKTTGLSIKSYILRRKLEYALYDLAQGKKVIDVALNYGFETHAGFTKAFKKCFGCPPSLYRLHVSASPPKRATITDILMEEIRMNAQVTIRNMDPLVIAGYPSRHRLTGFKSLSDIPAFWDHINLDYDASLSTLHHTYTESRHCEAVVCLDVDNEHDCFTYMLGVGVDAADIGKPPRPGVYLHHIKGGQYAVFTTPTVDEADYVRAIQEMWAEILTQWLPASEYEFDSTRDAYEYYDERDHGTSCCMDICIPITKRG